MPNASHLADDAKAFDELAHVASTLSAHGDASVRAAGRRVWTLVRQLRARDARPNPSRLRRAFRGSDIIARDVSAIIYVHAEDGGLYVHGFGHEPVMRQRGGDLTLSNLSRDSGVRAFGLPDGTVSLAHDKGLALWGDY